MNKDNLPLQRTNIVGVIASREDAVYATQHRHLADVYEWRVDCTDDIRILPLIKTLATLGSPIIVTVRDVTEGGKSRGWSIDDRAELYKTYLDLAAFIDIEASTVSLMPKEVLNLARINEKGIIISQHLSTESWSNDTAEYGLQIAREQRATIFKLAAMFLTPVVFAEMVSFVALHQRDDHDAKDKRTRIAPMAMGEKFGKVSRLLFSRMGSPLVYGYLDKPVAVGQYHVSKLRDMLSEL